MSTARVRSRCAHATALESRQSSMGGHSPVCAGTGIVQGFYGIVASLRYMGMINVAVAVDKNIWHAFGNNAVDPITVLISARQFSPESIHGIILALSYNEQFDKNK